MRVLNRATTRPRSRPTAGAIGLALAAVVTLTLGSGEPAVTVAVALITLPSSTEAATSTVMVRVREVPGRMLPLTLQLMPAAQDPPPLTVPDTKLVPAGVGRLTTTAVASDGPALLTVAV